MLSWRPGRRTPFAPQQVVARVAKKKPGLTVRHTNRMLARLARRDPVPRAVPEPGDSRQNRPRPCAAGPNAAQPAILTTQQDKAMRCDVASGAPSAPADVRALSRDFRDLHEFEKFHEFQEVPLRLAA